MQIVLKRIAKKKTYTIGRLYILKDEDVKKRTIESVNKCRGLKTVCEVPQEKLNADSYFCDTLEPCWRNLLGVELSPAEENVRLGRVSGKKAQKMKGKTAIPEGTYPVLITKSPRRFNTRREYSEKQAVMASACPLLKNNRYLSGPVL